MNNKSVRYNLLFKYKIFFNNILTTHYLSQNNNSLVICEIQLFQGY